MENRMKQRRAIWHTLPLLFVLICMSFSGCASLSLDSYQRTRSSAIPSSNETRLGREFGAQMEQHPRESGFCLLSSGIDSFLARAYLIDRSDHSLDLQYYIFYDDVTGRLLLERMVAAADRGVRIRLLVDDWNITGKDFSFAMIAAHPNIQVRTFNPFSGHRSLILSRMLQYGYGPKRLKRRMHNKVFIADNTAAIVGGRNIGDEYFGARTDVNFSDLDILTLGPITEKISSAFDEYWNSEFAIPIDAFVRSPPSVENLEECRAVLQTHKEKMKDTVYAEQLRENQHLEHFKYGNLPVVWTEGEYHWDRPGKVASSRENEPTFYMAPHINSLIDETQTEALLISPYFVPGKAGMQLFEGLRERGAKVKILTNSLASNDAKVVHAGYARYRKALLRLGVDLYEMKPTSGESLAEYRRDIGSSSQGALHAKTLVLDRNVLFVSSFNLDPRSAWFDTQNGIVVRSPEIARQVARLFETATSPENAYRVTFEAKLPGEDFSRPQDGKLTWITEEDGKEVRYYNEPMTRWWQRIGLNILSWFAPEEML
ncbi:MAG: phospholipase D family protein [Proteobacteria bacterium]|nr:phospholipase D family protein [Pseudomonadota bacterium]